MSGYYSEKLAADRLEKVYDEAPPRIRRYLEAEVAFVLSRIDKCNSVLDLGCGYGRILPKLASQASLTVGVDTSIASLKTAANRFGDRHGIMLAAMDAGNTAFKSGSFDAVACIQNGISAFGLDRLKLMKEALRVTRSGGVVLFSSYSENFWEDRLDWFRLQAKQGLLGEIDEDATGGGVIICKDGFKAKTVGRTEFETLANDLGLEPEIEEIDGSSLFCVLHVP